MSMTPKQIAKAIKAKGLQKTRWYCQMCQKQCRDANGFKNHSESEGHLRMMSLWREDAGKFTDEFSESFDRGMYEIIKRSYRHKKVHANVIYNEYIKDRHHVHLNSTQWTTLSDYCRYLGQSGKCKLEETTRGFYLSYIENDPEILMQERKTQKRTQMELDEEDRQLKELEKRVAQQPTVQVEAPTSVDTAQAASIGFKFKVKSKKQNAFRNPSLLMAKNDNTHENNTSNTQAKSSPLFEKRRAPDDEYAYSSDHETREVVEYEPLNEDNDVDRDEEEEQKVLKMTKLHHTAQPHRKKLALEELKQMQEKTKDRKNRTDNWLFENLVVKVINEELMDGKYFEKKGVVKKVFDKTVGVIHMLDSKDVIKLSQDDLETVIPSLDSLVFVVNGAYRGAKATLLAIDQDAFKAKIHVESGQYLGNTAFVEFEDICKYQE